MLKALAALGVRRAAVGAGPGALVQRQARQVEAPAPVDDSGLYCDSETRHVEGDATVHRVPFDVFLAEQPPDTKLALDFVCPLHDESAAPDALIFASIVRAQVNNSAAMSTSDIATLHRQFEKNKSPSTSPKSRLGGNRGDKNHVGVAILGTGWGLTQ